MRTHLLLSLAFSSIVVIGCSSSSDDAPAGGTDTGVATDTATPPTDGGTDTTPATDGGSDTTASDSTASDSPPSDSGSCTTRGTAPACNTLTGSGDFIITQRVASTYTTAPVSGTLAEGTYVLTKSTEYTGAGGATGPSTTQKPSKNTAFFGCGRYDQYYEEQGGSAFTIDADATLTGTAMKLHSTCPGVADSGFTISITSTGFLGYNIDASGKGIVGEYTKK